MSIFIVYFEACDFPAPATSISPATAASCDVPLRLPYAWIRGLHTFQIHLRHAAQRHQGGDGPTPDADDAAGGPGQDRVLAGK